MESFVEDVVDDEGDEGGEVIDEADDDAEGKITAMREPELGREGPHIFSVFMLLNLCSFGGCLFTLY